MKDFESRWQACAGRAREASPAGEQAPHGFAARVLARSRDGQADPGMGGWDRVLVRMLAAAVAVLLACVAFEGRHLRDRQPLDPGIENTVAQLVWRL
jgi:hypothetical protein